MMVEIDYDKMPKHIEPICPFCGEHIIADLATDFKDIAAAEAYAREHCDCEAAQKFRAEQRLKADTVKKIEKAKEQIEILCDYCGYKGVEVGEETRELLLLLSRMVIRGEIDGAGVRLSKINCKLSMTAKGALSVGYTYSESNKIET
jgi:ribosomal protein L44E